MTEAWDVFHSERLEVDRAVPDATVRARLRAGTLTPDDLVRPAGTTRWSRIEQVAELLSAPPSSDPEPPLSLLPLILRPEPEPESDPTPLPASEPSAHEPAPRAELELEFPDDASTGEFGAIDPVEPSKPSEPSDLIELVDPSESIEAEPVFAPPPPTLPDRPGAAGADATALVGERSGSIEAEPVFAAPPPGPSARPVAPPPPPAHPGPEPGGSAVAAAPIFEPTILPDDEDEEGEPAHPSDLGDPEPHELEGADAAAEDGAASFTLSRGQTERVEELDLAAMVDVAFQLVLFFLVTASTVVFKTLEIPKPSEDKPPEVAAQSRAKTVEELEKDFILVEIDAEGNFRVDHLPVAAERSALTEKLRQARETTGRKALLLSTDPATRHRVAVLATDIASEINLEVSWAKTASP